MASDEMKVLYADRLKDASGKAGRLYAYHRAFGGDDGSSKENDGPDKDGPGSAGAAMSPARKELEKIRLTAYEENV